MMSETPDPEIRFRSQERTDTGCHADDEQFEDTIEDHRYHRQDRGGGDIPMARGFERQDMNWNGTDFQTGNPYRMSIKPEAYDGVEDWEEYISHFEICAELGKWRDQEKVLALAAALKGLARTFYISLSQTEKRNYRLLIQKLGQRFGSTRQQNRWLSRLESRRRGPGESVAALADDLRQMTRRAYTDLDARAQEVLAMNQLYKSVSPDVKYQCTNQNCKTVSEAVEVIERYEAILGDSQDRRKSSVRMVDEVYQRDCQSTIAENTFQDTLQSLTRRISELETKREPKDRPQSTYRSASRPFNNRPEKDIKCFLCGNTGHICRNCPVYLRCKEDINKQGNNGTPQRQTNTRSFNRQHDSAVQGNLRRPLDQ